MIVNAYSSGTRYRFCAVMILAPATIYSDKVVITVWSKEPYAFLIRSKEVARSYRSYFELLWKVAKA